MKFQHTDTKPEYIDVYEGNIRKFDKLFAILDKTARQHTDVEEMTFYREIKRYKESVKRVADSVSVVESIMHKWDSETFWDIMRDLDIRELEFKRGNIYIWFTGEGPYHIFHAPTDTLVTGSYRLDERTYIVLDL